MTAASLPEQAALDVQEIVFVTGAAGFIGGHVCERLLELGHKVVGIDNFNSYYDPEVKKSTAKMLSQRSSDMHFAEASVVDKTRLMKLFEEFQPTVVCHLAAQAGVRHSMNHLDDNIETNIVGTTNVLEAARIFGVKNVVCASSSSVYGKDSVAPFDESQVCATPISPYACTKRCCELFAHTFHHLYQMNVTMLRFFTVYGPRGRPDMAAFRFIKSIHEGGEVKRFGDGSARREFTYISDIVDGVVSAIYRPQGYALINLGGGSIHTVNEFIAVIEKVVGKKANIRAEAEQPGDVTLTSADQTIAKALLGFQPKVSLEEGIRRTYDWFLTSSLAQNNISEKLSG